MDDFRACARELFGFRGIWVPWRSSTHGQCHYAGYGDGHNAFPGMYWFAGTAWWAWFYYDYWLYTGDEVFFEEQLKPYFLESAAFYEDYLCVQRYGTFVLVPSYSPENTPTGGHDLQPNDTMAIASIRQLLLSLLRMADKLGVDGARQGRWRELLARMPGYTIDPSGALSEWAWPAVTNNEEHRHASHLYPLYDGMAPEIAENPRLREACRVAIEKRLAYRRAKNGAEMAFGIVQLGMAASYLRDRALACECVEWLTNSYWSPAMVSRHDPGEILNLDISGGLPAVIINMLVQSQEPSASGGPWPIAILPCLPDAWPGGSLHGVRCRGGFEVSLAWAGGCVTSLKITGLRGERCVVECNGRFEELALRPGEVWELGRS
jgi:alpha-L-fucosidase 2